MKLTLTKRFSFSASFSGSNKIHAHNYALGVTVSCNAREIDDAALAKRIDTALIQKVQSRDLRMDVDFLKSLRINESNLLKIFWKIIRKEIHPLKLLALSLARDKGTAYSLTR